MRNYNEKDILLRKLKRFFPDKADRHDVVGILNEYGNEKHEQEPDRVRLAILKISDKTVESIRKNTAIAKQDFRDALVAAEYPHQSKNGQGAETIFECSSLRYLYIDAFKTKRFSPLKNLSSLEYLTIGNCSFNEPEIFQAFKRLRKLVLLNCRELDHLDGIDKLVNLEWLTIDGSRKLNRIDQLSSLKNLHILQLSNNKKIDTLSSIKELTQLKALSFFGDTVFSDGDLSFLESFPSLSLVGFTGRRHFTHKPARTWNWKNYESDHIGIVRK